MVDSGFDVELKNPCGVQKDHCLNCHSFILWRLDLTYAVLLLPNVFLRI